MLPLRFIATGRPLRRAVALTFFLIVAALACSSATDLPTGVGGSAGAPGAAGATGGIDAAGAGGAGGKPTTTAGAASGGASSGSASGGSGGQGVAGQVTGGTSGSGGAPPTAGTSSGGSAGAGGVVRSNGCGKTSTLTFGAVPGESGQTTGVGAGGYLKVGNRGAAVRLPDNYDKDKPYWVVFGFHWNGGNSKEVDTGGTNGYNMSHFGLQKLSKNGAIFVAPDGLNAGWANSGGQDLQLVDDILELLEDNYCVDKKRIFANGFSYGGGMSYAIACSRADVFRAVAIYNGAVLSGCEGGNSPIAYWQMAGLTDNTCTIDVGRSMRDRFVKNNGCTAQSPLEPAQPPPFSADRGHVCTTYTGCSSGHPLRWCAHQSGHGNAVVDGTGDLYNSCATAPKTCSDDCPCTWVPEDVWSFFNSL